MLCLFFVLQSLGKSVQGRSSFKSRVSLARADQFGQGRDQDRVNWCVIVPASKAGDWVSTELGRVSLLLLLPDNAGRQRAVTLLVCVSCCAETAAFCVDCKRAPLSKCAISLDRPRFRLLGTLQVATGQQG